MYTPCCGLPHAAGVYGACRCIRANLPRPSPSAPLSHSLTPVPFRLPCHHDTPPPFQLDILLSSMVSAAAGGRYGTAITPHQPSHQPLRDAHPPSSSSRVTRLPFSSSHLRLLACTLIPLSWDRPLRHLCSPCFLLLFVSHPISSLPPSSPERSTNPQTVPCTLLCCCCCCRFPCVPHPAPPAQCPYNYCRPRLPPSRPAPRLSTSCWAPRSSHGSPRL